MSNVNFRLAASLALLIIALALVPPAARTAPSTTYEKSVSDLAKSADKESAHDRLWKLFDLQWKHQMQEYPEWATAVGYPGQNGRWTDLSLAAIARRKQELDAPLEALKSIDRSKLDEADCLNYDLFKYKLEDGIEGRRFKDEFLRISQLDDGVQQEIPFTIIQSPHSTVQDYEDILSRLKSIPTVIDQSIVLLQEGVKSGITPPKITVRDVPAQIRSQLVNDPTKSQMFEPFTQFPSTIPNAEQERLRKEASQIIMEKVTPSFKKLLDYVTTSYLPDCREKIACTALPDGEAWYACKVHQRTTTRLTPAEIHEKGLAEVKRIRAEIEAVMKEIGFKGTFQELSNYLRTDPKFYYDDPQKLLIGYRDIAKRIDPELMKQFRRLPRLQYGVVPVPAYAEKTAPTAYYYPGTLAAGRPGLFYANTYNTQSRPKWEMEVLTLHEAVPGHHLQISVAQEQENLPEFRKHGEFTAYVEGWGLYSESLGSELGMYKDAYSHFGQLTYDMWRAIRLVVDTGMHSMGWSRQQSIDFFKENCSKSEHDMEVEVDRYIVWPGQALAYKLGQLKIKELKAEAQRELGNRFDVRAFHDAVLATGAVPLDVLKEQIERWIAREKAVGAVK